jgi:hypothetical protein
VRPTEAWFITLLAPLASLQCWTIPLEGGALPLLLHFR